MLTISFLRLDILPAGLAALTVSLFLSGCHDRNQPPTSPTANAPTAAEISRENELKAREDAVAQREAEVAAKEQAEETRKQAEADEADAKEAAAATLAAKKVAKKPAPATSSTSLASSTSPTAPMKPVENRVEVPSGTALTVALSSDLSSRTAKAGDPFEATVASNLSVNGQLAVPTGSRVTGTITDVVSGSRAIGSVPMLGIKFNQIVLEDGETIPITGDLVQQGKSEKGQDTAKILGGAAAGAILGHQVKKNDSGKVIGGLLGGAVGAVAAKRTGTEVQLPAGSTLTITTGEPFSVNVQ